VLDLVKNCENGTFFSGKFQHLKMCLYHSHTQPLAIKETLSKFSIIENQHKKSRFFSLVEF
jgi:hypothetical protein